MVTLRPSPMPALNPLRSRPLAARAALSTPSVPSVSKTRLGASVSTANGVPLVNAPSGLPAASVMPVPDAFTSNRRLPVPASSPTVTVYWLASPSTAPTATTDCSLPLAVPKAESAKSLTSRPFTASLRWTVKLAVVWLALTSVALALDSTVGATPSTRTAVVEATCASVSEAAPDWPSSSLLSVPPAASRVTARAMPSLSKAPAATVWRKVSSLVPEPATYSACTGVLPTVTCSCGVPPPVFTVTARSKRTVKSIASPAA